MERWERDGDDGDNGNDGNDEFNGDDEVIEGDF
jgi:hypothetical protein